MQVINNNKLKSSNIIFLLDLLKLYSVTTSTNNITSSLIFFKDELMNKENHSLTLLRQTKMNYI